MEMKCSNLCPPPHNFHPARDVSWAKFIKTPAFASKSPKLRGARAEGIRYEKKVHRYIKETFPDLHINAPWLEFRAKFARRSKICQPDALIINPRLGTITVIEIKLQHTSNAWWQVRRLYTPVVEKIFGNSWKYLALEVVHWFDPHTKFPEHCEFINSLEELHLLAPGKFYIHIYSGRGL